MEHNTNKFIPGVEGLRAIAILAVLINHLDSSFMPGGYLGVNLFFVVSGFVVSRSLDNAYSDTLKNYLVNFFSKRIKRLFPALLVSFVLITLIGELFFEGLGKSTIRTGAVSLLGLSNIFLIYINTDYFGLGSEFNLFLPTWSLGIEEQFYFFFPLLLFWLKKEKKRVEKYILIILTISFAFFVTFHFTSKNYQYYFPLSRLWELLAGALLHFYTAKNSSLIPSKLKFNLMVPILLFFLVLLFFFPVFVNELSTNTYFTFAAPLICLVSLGLIYSATKFDSLILTNSVMLYIGKLSYSIYLYHFAILKLINPGQNWYMILLSIFAILFISMGSYYFIETPIRNKKWPKLSALNLISFVGTTAVTSALIVIYTRGMPEKDPFMHPTAAQFKISQCNFFDSDNTECNFLSKGNKKLFFLGDSHSNALSPVMTLLHSKDKYEVWSISTSGLTTTTMNGFTRTQMQPASTKGLEFVLKNISTGDTVIMTSQLMTWFSKTLNDDPEMHRLTFKDKLISQQEALQIYINERKDIAKSLRDKKVNLIITAPFPDFRIHPSKCYSPIGNALGWDVQDKRCQTTRSDQESRRKEIVSALNKLKDEELNIKIFDPINLICDESICNSYKGNTPVYYDDDHVNLNLSNDIYSKLSESL